MRARLASALLATAALVAGVVGLGSITTAASADPQGNNGTVKIAGFDADGQGNDPHVGCTFTIRWFGFDKGDIKSRVDIELQSPSDATMSVTGPREVSVGGDAAGGGTDLDGEQEYTLAFTGVPHPKQGYHVKITVNTPGSKGSDKKSKVFWVQPCAGDPEPTDPPTPTDPPAPEPTDPPAPEPTDPPTPTPPSPPFDWNWEYPAPTCDALTVTYPRDLPAGQANDANIRFESNVGQFTLNFHHNEGTWSGTHVFDYRSHPRWPAGVTTYHVVWVQVAGTNYHWQGDVSCAPLPTADPEAPFTWEWTYPDPTCTALTVGYPANIPAGQANDANIRFESNVGQFTLNFHHNEGTWSGTHVFDYRSHPRWPAGVTDFHVVWVQVAGTNYHWQGDRACVIEDGAVKAATAVDGFRTGKVTVKRGARVAGRTISIDGAGFQTAQLQMSTAGASAWRTVGAVTPSIGETARVQFPTLKKKGTYRFRVAIPGTDISTGDTSGVLTVRVR